MASPYTKDLALEVAYKIKEVYYVYKLSLISTEWNNLLTKEFWSTMFIRNFGARLPNGANYELERVVIGNISLIQYYNYAVSKSYYELLDDMLKDKEVSGELLRLSIIFNDLDMVSFLVDKGADLNARNCEPLRLFFNNRKIYNLLISKGAIKYL